MKKILLSILFATLLKIADNLFMGDSTVKEYIEGEEWVSSILDNIQEEWTDIQKLAYIDTAIGKKISYAPYIITHYVNIFNISIKNNT